MDEKTKEYVESCIEIVKQDLKLYKKFQEFDHNKYWLQDAEQHIEIAEMALKQDILCPFIRRNK